MSNINNQEPQAYGSITLKTTFGSIDIELFTKQCPKATRNFVQHCLDGFYEGTIFDRVEKDFIAVGGVPAIGVVNDYEPFADEFHSRLRFTRRGLLATANTSKNDNGPVFFFTLGATPELQNKHTIFGRAKGKSVYTLVELNECQVDHNFRPESEQKILETIVVDNPFDDIKPQRRFETRTVTKGKPNESSSGSDDESDDDDQYKKRKVNKKKLKFATNDESDSDMSDGSVEVKFSKIPDESPDIKRSIKSEHLEKRTNESFRLPDEELEQKDGKKEMDEKEAKLREIRAQIQRIKEQIDNGTETKTLSERRKDQSDMSADSATSNSDSSFMMKKRKDRERETLELVTNFKKKIKQVAKDPVTNPKEELKSDQIFSDDELAALDLVDGDDWLKHRFEADDDTVVAKDANMKGRDWYSLDDPRKYYDRHYEKHHQSESRTRSNSHRHHKRSNHHTDE